MRQRTIGDIMKVFNNLITAKKELDLIDNESKTWNSAIDTIMEVIELQPLIDQSNKNRIQEIAKGLKK